MHPHAAAPPALDGVYAIAGFWALFTLLVYATIFYGSFVKLWGVDYSLTFDHYVKAFAVGWNEFGIHWRGSAWSSFWTTMTIALVSAPLTADDRAAHRLSAGAAGFRRQARLRVRHHAVLRHSRHGDRRLLRHRLQRAADRAHRHRHHPGAVLHLPQHAGRRAGRRRLDVADRPQPRRILADARRQFLADLSRHRAAAAAGRRSWRRWSIPSCAP